MEEAPVDGGTLAYREAGRGPPVLLIHGGGIDNTDWGDIFDDLAADHRVIAYDRRGYRTSVQPPTADWRRHADEAYALLRHLDAAPAVVAGWSGGGLVALHLAVDHADAVAGLALLETPLHGRRHVTPALVRTFLTTHLLRRVRGSEEGMSAMIRWLCTFRDGGDVWHRITAEERRRLLENAPAFWVEWAATDTYPTRERLRTIACPTVWAVGERSHTWFLRTATAGTKSIPTSALRTIPGANHALGLSAPHETAQLIREVARSPSATHA